MINSMFNRASRQSYARMSESLMGLQKHLRTAVTGPHRTGKTTMAMAYAEVCDIPYVDASVTRIMQEGGFDASASYASDFATRLKAQRYLLDALDLKWDMTDGGFVSDRSPLCFAMYTLCDITGSTDVSPGLSDELVRYLNDCKAVTLKHFNTVVLVPPNPAIPLAAAPGKAAANPAYIHNLYVTAQYLLGTLERREDVAPEDDELRAFPELLEGPDGGVERVQRVWQRLAKQGRDVEALYGLFAEDAASTTLTAMLPHKAASVEDRAAWLADLNQRQVFQWLQKGLEEGTDSPYLQKSGFLDQPLR